LPTSNAQLKLRLYRACLLVLAAGLCAAALAFALVPEATEEGVDYVVVDGVAYPVDQRRTKPYARTRERFGGKAALLFDDLNRWFAGLWRGKALALTIACLSTGVAIAMYLFALWLPDDRE
jgi:hypothetical protein